MALYRDHPPPRRGDRWSRDVWESRPTERERRRQPRGSRDWHRYDIPRIGSCTGGSIRRGPSRGGS